MDEHDLHWLAGLLEGEGCFTWNIRAPRKDGVRLFSAGLQVNMNDRDVIQRVARLLDASVLGPYGAGRGGNPNAQPFFSVRLDGNKAARAMKMLKPHMGRRRRARINEVLKVHLKPSE